MILDITQAFKSYAEEATLSHTRSTWNASTFLKSSTSHLFDLNSLSLKLGQLQKTIQSQSRFSREETHKKILNVRQNLTILEQNIKRLTTTPVDIKAKKNVAETFKESIIITLEMRFLLFSFRFKQLYLQFNSKSKKSHANQGNLSARAEEDNKINLNRSHFLESSQDEMMEESVTKEYKELEKSIHEIAEMYQETLATVRMHEYLIDSIDNHISEADEHVMKGRNNLSSLSQKQSKNRSTILKMFGLLYLVVFSYLVILS